MPPKKEKVEKTSVEAGSALVLEYLKQQNRPYSAIEISANLHSKVTKAQAPKILKELSESNQITSKASGKQIIYHAIQDPQENLSPQELEQIDNEIKSLNHEIAMLKDEEKLLKSGLTDLKATATLAELEGQLAVLTKEKDLLDCHLTQIKLRPAEIISKEEKTEVEMNWKLWSYKARARKKACMELWNALVDNLPETKSKDELWEELGLEVPEKA